MVHSSQRDAAAETPLAFAAQDLAWEDPSWVEEKMTAANFEEKKRPEVEETAFAAAYLVIDPLTDQRGFALEGIVMAAVVHTLEAAKLEELEFQAHTDYPNFHHN